MKGDLKLFLNVFYLYLKVLIARGADVNAGLSERSPLHYAVLSDAPEVVRELLESGACPDTPQVRSVFDTLDTNQTINHN